MGNELEDHMVQIDGHIPPFTIRDYSREGMVEFKEQSRDLTVYDLKVSADAQHIMRYLV